MRNTVEMKLGSLVLVLLGMSLPICGMDSIEKWDFHELSLQGPASGNPYKEVQLTASFSLGPRTVTVSGFYEGQGIYKIRFMPDAVGQWTYLTTSKHASLNNKQGHFTCVKNTGMNHGPVRVAHKYHFAHADGHPFKPFGTTCYMWHHEAEERQEQTVKTLSTAPFNKVRMLVFPWSFVNKGNPALGVFQSDSEGKFDFERFNPAYWANLEKRLHQLRALGIEADMIVMHGALPKDAEEFYLQYLTSRIAPFRNVWWCLANEFNLDKSKTQADWDRHGHMLAEKDPYQHLLSNHNHPAKEFDWSKAYITHVAAQYADQVFVASLREKYQKPVINEEPQYEGDHFCHWGNISAQEMVHRFWLGAVNGIYTTHGETYARAEWSGPGGHTVGESPQRIAFLRDIMEEGPVQGINNYKQGQFWQNLAAGDPNNYLLLYFGVHQPGIWYFDFPEDGSRFAIDLIDPWNMTIDPMKEIFTGKVRVKLPGKPRLALRARRID